jgi:hypothetical protein
LARWRAGRAAGAAAAGADGSAGERVRETEVVVCPATWGRGDDPAAGRKLGEGDVYPDEWVRLPNHFVE